MELQDLTKGDKFKIAGVKDCPVITFHHLDGMYSYNTHSEGEVINLRFNTPVVKHEMGE